MPERTGGGRRKTRQKYKKNIRKQGKVSLQKFFQEFKEGDKVGLYMEPAYQRGMYHRRFYGKIAVVSGKQGECYKVDLNEGKMKKTFIVHPVHLKRI